MRRLIVPLVLVLAIATGAVLDATWRVARSPVVALGADPQSRAAAAVVRRFYGAVDAAMETGDVAALDRIVAADFVDHAPRPGATPDRTGLLGAVAALHGVAPGRRLAVADLVAADDWVATRVAIEGGDAAFLGLPVAASCLWGPTDFFRVAGGQVIEHWGDAAGLASFAPVVRASVPVDRPTRKSLTLERWTYAPDAAETRGTNLGFLVLVGDSGRLTVQLGARTPGSGPVAGGTARTLGPGDTLAIPGGWRFTLANDGEAPAVVLVVAASTPTTPGGKSAAAVAPPTGIARAVLARGLAATLPTGDAEVAIGRAVLGPGAVLAAHRVGTVELAAVEAGALALTADGGDAWVSTPVDGATRRADGETVSAGGGVLAAAGTTVGYRTAEEEPLALLLVTVAPDVTGPASPIG